MSYDPALSPEEAAALKKDFLSSLHCALPGTVENFDPSAKTVSVRPASPALPLLRDVPVFLPAAWEIRPGDRCLVVFADCGEDGVPGSGRMHSLSDGFAFVGF